MTLVVAAIAGLAAAAAAGGLLSRSVGGGIALGIVFILVFDGFISYIPGLEHFTYGALTQDLSNGITGTGETHNGLVVALLGSIAWCALIITPGWIRYLRSDLK